MASAQVDDIYATGAEQRNGGKGNSEAVQPGKTGEESATTDRPDSYSDNNAPDNYQSYNNGEDYVDYDEGYTYSSRINRFDNSFYNMGYYSAFYNPFWYDPYWYDPYWGYRPWYPSYAYGYGCGPYWSSSWGWNTWYGYGGFSCWSYPYYAGGWYGNCYNGYWNSYYAGVDGQYNNYRSVGYGPRQHSIGNRMGNRMSANGFRASAPINQIGLRTSPLRASEPTRAGLLQNSNTGRSNMPERRYGNNVQRGEGRMNGGENNSRNSNPSRSYFGDGSRGQERSFQNDGRSGRESSRNRGGDFGNGPSRMSGNEGGGNSGRMFNGRSNAGGSPFSGGGGNSGRMPNSGGNGGGRSFNGGGNSGGHSNGGGNRSSGGGGGSRGGRR